METREIKELLISAIVIAIAFSIATLGGVRAFFHPEKVIEIFPISLIVVSLGFILHELGHRTVARIFGCYASYRMWPNGLLLALLLSLAGFLFAAPGAVIIHPRIDLWGRVKPLSSKKYGMIAAAGPAANFLLAIIFKMLFFLSPLYLFQAGSHVNAFLGIFNLIPFYLFDGKKVFNWDVKVWLFLVIVGIGLLFL